MLILFGGLPGVGKTTVASAVAQSIGATYLRIDELIVILRNAGALTNGEVGPTAHFVAYGVARSNLLGGSKKVVADLMCGQAEERDRWAAIASDTGSNLIQMHIVCSDIDEHESRVQQRKADIEGLTLPSWAHVQRLNFEPWPEAIRLDTAGKSERTTIDEAVGLLRRADQEQAN